MKKKLESDLISIAHRILKLKGKEDVNKLYAEVSELYEKLSVLKFAQENFEDNMPTIGSGTSFFDSMEKAFNNKVSDTIEVEDQVYVNVDESEDDDIFEPVMEKIKDMVAQMPQETHAIDAMVEAVIPHRKTQKNELEELVAGFQEMPVFEPVTEANKRNSDNEIKSLNDKLKKEGFSIGLNDKLAFIKHLFDGKSEDYERVLSQINTSESYEEVNALVQNIIKPDYNYWEGKTEYEERFMEIIESKFN
ncbi:MAG: hypothetical protein DA407_06605 [Bacteroidetes bacterium]|nr:MAG: hypothetical protein DA407_06605 [Bacteroidota bacterium]